MHGVHTWECFVPLRRVLCVLCARCALYSRCVLAFSRVMDGLDTSCSGGWPREAATREAAAASHGSCQLHFPLEVSTSTSRRTRNAAKALAPYFTVRGLEAGGWRLEAGGWRLEALEAGGRRLEAETTECCGGRRGTTHTNTSEAPSTRPARPAHDHEPSHGPSHEPSHKAQQRREGIATHIQGVVGCAEYNCPRVRSRSPSPRAWRDAHCAPRHATPRHATRRTAFHPCPRGTPPRQSLSLSGVSEGPQVTAKRCSGQSRHAKANRLP